MTIIDFLQHIQNPDATARTQAISVLGMVEDTRALAPLQAHYPQEPDKKVKQAIEWAGKRLAIATERGYDIYQDILERFSVYTEIRAYVEAGVSDYEADLLRRVAIETGSDSISMGTASTLGRAFIGYQMGGIAGASLMAMSDMARSQSHGEYVDPTQGMPRRAVPQTPTNNDYRPALQALLTHPQADMRVKAMQEIGRAYNLAALPHVFRPFLRDSDPTVRQTVEHVAKSMYLSALYAKLSNEGIIEQEVQQQIADAREELKRMGHRHGTPKGNQESSPEELQALLNRAQEKKQQQRRKRR